MPYVCQMGVSTCSSYRAATRGREKLSRKVQNETVQKWWKKSQETWVRFKNNRGL